MEDTRSWYIQRNRPGRERPKLLVSTGFTENAATWGCCWRGPGTVDSYRQYRPCSPPPSRPRRPALPPSALCRRPVRWSPTDIIDLVHLRLRVKRARTTSRRPKLEAMYSGVWPSLSALHTSAFASKRARTISRCPIEEAQYNGVSPPVILLYVTDYSELSCTAPCTLM